MMCAALIGSEDEIYEMAQTPLVRAWLLQAPAAVVEQRGFEHPDGQRLAWLPRHRPRPADP